MSDIHNELEKLRSRLAISATLYQSDQLDHQRKSVISALGAVADFLETQDFPQELLPPILRPALALAEREKNNLDQMFAQRARGGRPQATLDDLDRTAIMASFANAWLRMNEDDGRPQGVKLAEAARKMRGGWFGDVTRSKLKSARELVSQESSDHPAVLIAETFDDLFQHAVELVGRTGAFQFMLDFVNRSPAARIRGIWKTPPVSPSDDS